MSETTNATEESARIRAEFTVEGALSGMRLDAALAGALDAPRTRTSGWIRDGHVTVTNNGKVVKIGKSYKLSVGDEVVVDAPAPTVRVCAGATVPATTSPAVARTPI